jgi:RNA polymerase sigma-70 factor, ECF subfamily
MAASIVDLNPDQTADAPASDDQRLADGLRAGDNWAYEALLARYQLRVFALALRLVNVQSEASDVTQEVFLKVFRSIRSFRGQSSLKTWIYRITVNEAHNSRRWSFRHRRNEVDLDANPQDSKSWRETIPDSGSSPFEETLHNEQRAAIETALGHINPIFREAVVLRDMSDLSYEEIAEVLGVTLGTVKSRIMRGREALRVELTESLRPAASLRLASSAVE